MKFLLAFILGLIIPFVALFIGLYISPGIADILLTPLAAISVLIDKSFTDISMTTHAFLVVALSFIFFFIFYTSSKLIFSNKKLSKQ